MNESRKSNIWLYAVILFTSAFIVLLFAGYSQIKMNRSLEDYKSQVFDSESEKNKHLQNFYSAQEMNEKLNNDISMLEEDNRNLKEEKSLLESKSSALQEELDNRSEANEHFAAALASYLNGDFLETIELLKDVEVEYLEPKVVKTCRLLESRTKTEAGQLLFDEGFTLYEQAEYEEAAKRFLSSIEIAPAEVYSDKCLYYLAYAQMRSGNTSSAVVHMSRLAEDYPDSKYLKRAKQFVTRYKK
ncbi:MAG: hypothetical protein GXY17_05815 [Clostridiaceae bacterium]|jgi:TolA-binding protein|nr:hypothetical protein [Clostridiaceae bacterium]